MASWGNKRLAITMEKQHESWEMFSSVWLIHLRRVRKSLRFPLQHLESAGSVSNKPKLEVSIKLSLCFSCLI